MSLWFDLLLLGYALQRVQSDCIFTANHATKILTSLRRQHVMFLDGQLQGVTLLPDDVVNAFDDVADCEVHSVCLAQPLAQLPCLSEESARVDPLSWALVD